MVAAKRHDEAAERVERSKEAVLGATYQLLTETGLGGVSVDAAARRSGVAKTTIYRHWPPKSALLLSACAAIGAKPNVPDTGTLRGDLEELVVRMASNLRGARWASVLPSIIDAAERDPEIAEVYARLHEGFMSALTAVLERGRDRGELPRSEKIPELVAAIAGSLFYRRWFSREPLDDEFAKAVIRRAIGR